MSRRDERGERPRQRRARQEHRTRTHETPQGRPRRYGQRIRGTRRRSRLGERRERITDNPGSQRYREREAGREIEVRRGAREDRRRSPEARRRASDRARRQSRDPETGRFWSSRQQNRRQQPRDPVTGRYRSERREQELTPRERERERGEARRGEREMRTARRSQRSRREPTTRRGGVPPRAD